MASTQNVAANPSHYCVCSKCHAYRQGHMPHISHYCSCGKCYECSCGYVPHLQMWVPICFSWFIGLHSCPCTIKAELTLEPRCRRQADGESVWFGLFVVNMKLTKDKSWDLNDCRNIDGTYYCGDWDMHISINTYKIRKRSDVNSPFTAEDLWNQKMAMIAKSQKTCTCNIAADRSVPFDPRHLQWYFLFGGKEFAEASHTMNQCFQLNGEGPPVYSRRSFTRPGPIFHISAKDDWRQNNKFDTKLIHRE